MNIHQKEEMIKELITSQELVEITPYDWKLDKNSIQITLKDANFDRNQVNFSCSKPSQSDFEQLLVDTLAHLNSIDEIMNQSVLKAKEILITENVISYL